MSNFEFISNPIIPGQMMTPQPQQYMGNSMVQQYMMPQQQQIPLSAMTPVVQPQPIAVPKDDSVTIGNSYGFSIIPDNTQPTNILSVPIDIPDDNQVTSKRRGRKKKDDDVGEVNGADIVRVENSEVVEDVPTIYSYMQTTHMLQETLQQVDMIAGELKEELDSARLNRTLKNKHNYIVGLSANISGLLGTKIQVIREINSAISKSNEMDYKKEKDRRAADGAQNDDKYIMDMYTSFIRNPMGQDNRLAPNAIDSAVANIGGSGIIRSPLQAAQEGITDIGYLNYLNRLTPEQNMMFYEQNPNVKTVVVFDASTGNKFFQVMDMSTGQVVPNVPVMDNRFMEDTYIDVKNKVATNNNLHESYPVVVINEGVTAEY